MNAATTTQQKKIGDRVKITGGQNRDQIGTITAKERRGWVIELEDGSNVTIGFPMVVLIEVTEIDHNDEQTPAPDSGNTESVETVAEPTIDEVVNEAPADEASADEANQEADNTESKADNIESENEHPIQSQVETDSEDSTSDNSESQDEQLSADESTDSEDSATEDNAATDETDSPVISPEIAKMTVKKLWALAHERGVSVARTKADFFRIIKAKFPEEDLTVLKGKALFDKVSELHISRLRSKQEMARLLSA